MTGAAAGDNRHAAFGRPSSAGLRREVRVRNSYPRGFQGDIFWFVSEADRAHWDARYEEGGIAPILDDNPPPTVFADLEPLFPRSGRAFDMACGRGRAAVWLARRGMTDVWGVDVSPVAIGYARRLAEEAGVADRCSFDVHDLDDGLPAGPHVDLVLCHLFRDARLDAALMDRVAPRGLLAVASLSEVDVGPGRHRIPPGELAAAFATFDIIEHGERDGRAWIVARRPC